MIGDIIFGREKSKITLIEDTVLQNGRAILLSLLCQMCERLEKICLVCFERDPGSIMCSIPERYRNKIVPYDGSGDILGWEASGSLNIDTDLVGYLQSDQCFRPNHTTGIVLDSVSPLLLHRQPSYTCKTLVGLSTTKIHTADVEQVACLLHGDLHDNHTLSQVEHVATTVIKVKPPAIQQFFLSCHILHKRLSGKVIKMTEHLNIDEELVPVDITEIKSVDTSQVSMETNQNDPTANLTFNLSLTDKEKEAKSQIKLPYTYDNLSFVAMATRVFEGINFFQEILKGTMAGEQDETLNKSVDEPKIFYQPDEADDFDEEDPDDDLDI